MRGNAPLPQSRARNFIRRSSSVIIRAVASVVVVGSGFVVLAVAVAADVAIWGGCEEEIIDELPLLLFKAKWAVVSLGAAIIAAMEETVSVVCCMQECNS